MDDIIVIILTLIIMVAGAIGQAKKKNRQASANTGNPSRPDPSIWEFLDNQNMRNSVLFDQPDISPVANEPVKYRRYEDEPIERIENSYDIIKPRNEKEEQPLEQVNESLEDQTRVQMTGNKAGKIREFLAEEHKNKLPEGFSLKNAVIFSEIIQRKYF